MKLIQEMEYQNENGTAFLSGIIGHILINNILIGIHFDWQTVSDAVINLAWIGTVAAFSGGMGVLGKHYVGKLIKRFSKNKKS